MREIGVMVAEAVIAILIAPFFFVAAAIYVSFILGLLDGLGLKASWKNAMDLYWPKIASKKGK